VFLFDEPLSNLDAALRAGMRYELAKLHQELKTTMVYVTHDQVEAMTLAKRIVVLSAGRVEQVGTPMDVYRDPDNIFVAGFIGSPKMNFLKIPSAESDGKNLRLNAPDFRGGQVNMEAPGGISIQPATGVTLGIRPEHIEVTDKDHGKGLLKIEVVESLGDVTYLHGVTEAGNRITVSITGFHGFRHGDTTGFDFAAKDVHLFGPDEKALLV
jgi:ABC-type sugar transport system ATPase subunit